jgi:hypothetical protein
MNLGHEVQNRMLDNWDMNFEFQSGKKLVYGVWISIILSSCPKFKLKIWTFKKFWKTSSKSYTPYRPFWKNFNLFEHTVSEWKALQVSVRNFEL